ncbi:uncharacterized protein (TIGR00730 family) [Herbaspirillum sp. 1173]|uniref:LOG family protein n=1 Tax=Herbaspirillum sp. 1173 TaxID=2817734 RepID=UPI002861E00C|nr:TIGR00730 family Rossman fold protein [Herbaspirillum sp. 1173]MDR6742038.1 uncharacterized protein (TIGR00730 family) [Herbaspirillum sp. 1173]
MLSIAVFSGSSSGLDPSYGESARELGRALAKLKIRLICGGGDTGLMKTLADAVLESGGNVLAVVPEEMEGKEAVNKGVTQVQIVPTISDRKRKIQEMADGFLVLPGGVGMMDEFFYVYSQAKLGVHAKPIALLNTNSFFSPIAAMLNNMVSQNFIKEKHMALISFCDDPTKLLSDIIHSLQE